MDKKSFGSIRNYFSGRAKISSEGLVVHCLQNNMQRHAASENQSIAMNNINVSGGNGKPSDLSLLNQEKSLSCWFKTNSASKSQGIIGFSDKCRYSYIGLSYHNTFIIRRSAENLKRFNCVFENSAWYHILVFLKGDNLDDILTSRLWVNGREIRDICSMYKNSAPEPWSKLKYTGTQYPFDGELRNIRIYNRLLSQTEILALHNEFQLENKHTTIQHRPFGHSEPNPGWKEHLINA